MTTRDGKEESAELREPADSVGKAACRRLPFQTPPMPGAPEGRPCYLSSDDPLSLLSLTADDMEERIVQDGSTVLQAALDLIEATDGSTSCEHGRALTMTAQALTSVIRVAECRRQRLPAHDGSGEGSDDPQDAKDHR